MVIKVEKFVSILKEHDLKVTPQRIAILRYLETHHTHPSADTIYEDLKADNPSLSKTTIYNSLDMLKKHGLVKTLRLDSTVRYDYSANRHHHFWCRRCGKIMDITGDDPCWKDMVGDDHRVEEVHVYLKGVCSACLKKEKEED